MMKCSSDEATAAGATPPRSRSDRSGSVVGIPRRLTARSPPMLVGRWITTPSRPVSRWRRVTVTSSGDHLMDSTPHIRVAVRWDASAPGPADSTASATRWRSVAGDPRNRQTPNPVDSRTPERIAPSHRDRLTPRSAACSHEIRPCWLRARVPRMAGIMVRRCARLIVIRQWSMILGRTVSNIGGDSSQKRW